jgi:hypothetical protein
MSDESCALLRMDSLKSSYGEGMLQLRAQHKARLAAVEEFWPLGTAPLESIGRGSYGEVFKGTFEGKIVAMKKLDHEQVFDHEVNVLCQLDHDNIVRYIAHCKHELHGNFLLTEYLPSGNLRDYLKAHKDAPLSDATIHMVAEQLGSALYHMHSSEIPIFHRCLCFDVLPCSFSFFFLHVYCMNLPP